MKFLKLHEKSIQEHHKIKARKRHTKSMENNTKRDPKWEPKSVKKSEMGTPWEPKIGKHVENGHTKNEVEICNH